MKASNRFWLLTLSLPAILVLNGCSNGSSDGVRVSGTVYGGYGYPYYGTCCYDEVIIIERPDRPDRPERPEKPVRPLPGEPGIKPVDRPRSRPSTGMGRPSRPQMGAGTPRMPQGGGLRRR